MAILFLEPFYGGSHRDFAEGLMEHSQFDLRLMTLPARFWKWRMRGAALDFVGRLEEPEDVELVVVTDLMSVADLRALWPGAAPPIVLYFHENQLSYPLPAGKQLDFHFGLTDITSALAADVVAFNSRFHMQSFFSALPPFLRRMPEFRPTWVEEVVRRKARILYPGCRFPDERFLGAVPPGRFRGEVPRILWNHRWEFDKQPEVFFAVLRRLARTGKAFEVVVLGESFHAESKCFLEAKRQLGDRIIQFGFVESRNEYLRWLSQSDIVVSTACQENFGISVMEAMYYGCVPVLPHRLSYPELLPPEVRSAVLYDDEEALFRRLHRLISGEPGDDELAALRRAISNHARSFSWQRRIGEYDELFRSVMRPTMLPRKELRVDGQG